MVIENEGFTASNSSDSQDNQDSGFSLTEGLKKRKDYQLKTRSESAINSTGLSQRQFYEKVGISPAYWWRLSWGIDSFPVWLKIKLCDLFGKPFIDFFLQLEAEK